MASTIDRSSVGTDDDGTGTVGTVLNVAYVNAAIYQKVDDLLSGARANPLLYGGALSIGASAPNIPILSQGGSAQLTSGITYDGAGGWASGRIASAWTDGTRRASMQVSSVLGTPGAIMGTETNHAFALFANNTLGITLGTAGAIRFNAYGAGTLTTDGSGNITAASDETMKRILGALPYGLAEILKLHPIRYRWKKASGMETKGIYGGFGARAVHRVIPEAAFQKDGKYSLFDRPILGALVNAIKELHMEHIQLASELARRGARQKGVR